GLQHLGQLHDRVIALPGVYVTLLLGVGTFRPDHAQRRPRQRHVGDLLLLLRRQRSIILGYAVGQLRLQLRRRRTGNTPHLLGGETEQFGKGVHALPRQRRRPVRDRLV